MQRCCRRDAAASHNHDACAMTESRQNRTGVLVLCLAALLATATGTASAQTGKAPSLTMASVPLTTTPRTVQTMVTLNFRVPHGYHVNSNTPKSEFLIPTALKMNLGSATDIVL